MADKLVATSSTVTDSRAGIWGPYWINTKVGVIIFDGSDAKLNFARTIDGGENWDITEIGEASIRQIACWFDKETPDDSGNLIHISWLNFTSNTAFYRTVDVSDGSLGTLKTIDFGITVDNSNNVNRIAITKSLSGNIVVAFSTQTEIECYRSTDNGATWIDRADPFETATQEDYLLLYPANTGDNDDVVGIFWDRSANEISLKMYDESDNSWTETLIAGSMTDDPTHINMDAAVRHSDKAILFAAHSNDNDAGDDLMTWEILPASIASPTITAKDNIFTNQDESAQVAVLINQETDDVYVAYLKGGSWQSLVDVVFHKSIDGMSSWEAEQAYNEAAADDNRRVQGGRTISIDGGRIQWTFYNDDTTSIYVNLNNDIEILGVAAPIAEKITVWIKTNTSGNNFEDFTQHIQRTSLRVENIMTRQIDTATFTFRREKKDGSSFTPTAGREIEIYDGTTKIFAGNLVKVTAGSQSYKIVDFKVECNDFGRQLDRFLIVDSFKNLSIGAIIEFIVADKGLDTAGFTTNNVDATKVIESINFNYEPFSSVLTQLADLINYDWFVDFDKDIHFFAKDATDAPFGLTDTNGNFLFESFVLRKDNKQVKNVIFIRGGEYLGTNFTSEFISDGIQNIWTLPNRYDELKMNVTGEIWDGGIDEKDDINKFDYLWSNDEKFIQFRSDRIPNDTSSIRISGRPKLPVRIKLRDADSIADMVSSEGGTGEYEFLIVDKTINDKQGARDRARAELDSFKATLSEGEFITRTSGLKAGQKININSAAFGVNNDFIINKVAATLRTENSFKYKVSFITTRTLGIIDFLRSLALKDTKEIVINENEILDLMESFDESMAMSETVTSSIEHNLQEESMSIADTFTAQSLNFETKFVYHDIVPAGFDRPGNYSGAQYN